VHFTWTFIWKDFNKGFDETLSNFRGHIKSVEKEAGLSHMLEASGERALTQVDRLEEERRREGGSAVSYFHLSTHREWLIFEVAKGDLLLSYLSSTRYMDKHLRERKKRHRDTGTWLAETEQFKSWMTRDSSSALWCYGIRKHSSRP
jgi:hypothetical protein